MIARLFRKIPTADVIGLLLVGFALGVMAYGVSASLRNTDTTYFYYACMFAALIGMGLSISKMNGIQASAWLVALGISGAWIIGASLTSPLIHLIRIVFSLLPQIVPAIRSHIPIDTAPVQDAWFPIAQSSGALWMRLQIWLSGIFSNTVINDGLFRNLVWVLILWSVSAWAGWFMRRRNAILTLLPSLALLAVITSYSERKIDTVWVLMCILLLLMGVWNYKNHTHQWESQKFDYSESISIDVAQAVIFVSILIGTLAFLMPSVSWREIREAFQNRDRSSKNETAEMLGIEQSVAPAKNVVIRASSLPREHLLSGGFATSEKVVMLIRTGELPPLPSASLMVTPTRYYWRSVTYDTYVGAGWETSSAPSQSIQANTPLFPGLLMEYRLLHLDIEMFQPEGRLFWSGMLYSADVPISVNWRVRPPSDLIADPSMLFQADMFSVSTKADTFRVNSYISLATIDALRAASTEYPHDVAARYLILPSSVPARVHDLAREITQGLENPYDKAKAIERYLRTNYPYDLNVPTPPENQDVSDYFLFDLKKGYCDYYATAMVVLARSSGLPARFVSGYASGFYDAPNAQYVVREMDAHSWVEVYFPGIGWVEFEPTASEPEILRAQTNAPAIAPESSRPPAWDWLIRLRLERAVYWVLPLLSLMCVLILYFTLIEKWMVLRLTPALAIEHLHRKLYRMGRPFAGEYTPAETAYEFVDHLVCKVDELTQGSRFSKSLSALQREAITLTDLFHATLFINRPINKKDASMAWHTWKRLRWRLSFARILLFIKTRTSKKNRNGLME